MRYPGRLCAGTGNTWTQRMKWLFACGMPKRSRLVVSKLWMTSGLFISKLFSLRTFDCEVCCVFERMCASLSRGISFYLSGTDCVLILSGVLFNLFVRRFFLCERRVPNLQHLPSSEFLDWIQSFLLKIRARLLTFVFEDSSSPTDIDCNRSF